MSACAPVIFSPSLWLFDFLLDVIFCLRFGLFLGIKKAPHLGGLGTRGKGRCAY